MTQDAVKDVIQTTVAAEAGKVYDLTFNFSARSDGPQGDTDGFDVYWNGQNVGHFDPTQSAAWEDAHISVVGADGGSNTLEFRETGANDAYGALIADVSVVQNCGGKAGDDLFTENFDGYGSSVQTTYYDPADSTNAVFASVDLTAPPMAGSSGSDAAMCELGADGYGDIEATIRWCRRFLARHSEHSGPDQHLARVHRRNRRSQRRHFGTELRHRQAEPDLSG